MIKEVTTDRCIVCQEIQHMTINVTAPCLHKLCVANIRTSVEKYEKLLAFVKQLADSESTLNSVQENAACYEARELLKDIGEIE